ncbi:FAD-dependent monooxygenase [Actinomadura madurae]|uniref:FAD-dependent monooxygenase n=1 Tax=Actinomadura madurae TaxID=1993 RepID=UPI00399BAE5C
MVKDNSVIIVGAGSVGLATAVGLAQAGISVRVIETGISAPTGARDTVYHWSILGGFERLGVLEECRAEALRTDGWTYAVRRTGERIHVGLAAIADDVPHPYNLHVGQQTVTRAFLSQLERHGGVVDWGTTVTGIAQDSHGVTVLAEGGSGAQTYRADWVVGADGARSIVRRDLGLALAGLTWPDRFVATNLYHDFGADGFDIAGYQIDPSLGAVVAQVDARGLWRYIFAESRLLPEETIDRRVDSVLRQVLPEGVEARIDGSHPYRIHQRSAESFRVGRALLVGDAAHLTNPTLTLGMTSGLADAYSLIEALSAVIVDHHDDEILDRYSEVRRENFWNYTSPLSTAAKDLVFPVDEAAQRDEIDLLRRTVANTDALRRYLLHMGSCVSQTLLGGTQRRP